MPADIVDFQFPVATISKRHRGLISNVRHPFWESFYDDTIREIFEQGGYILDIGGGLRIDAKRGDKENANTKKRFGKYLNDPRVTYVVSDYTNQYHPDLVEDIHNLSLADNSADAILCNAVLEHVYDPKKACEEIVRVLKKDGHGFIYVPFMYRYHANLTEDYKDYFRYSKDGIAYLFRDCASITICPVRGLFESLLRFTPLHRIAPLVWIVRLIDWSSKRMSTISERQSSGYFIHVIK